MNKQLIGNFGSGFSHAPSSTLFKVPKYITWKYNELLPHTFWCDNSIPLGIHASCPNKYAWMVESKSIVEGVESFVKNNVELISKSYKYLFTHNREIYELAENFIFIPSHCSWIEEPQLYNKTKLCSMISSNKDWTAGHKKRLSFVDKFKDQVDLFGFGFNPIDKKEDGLKDYCFSICVENDSYPTYFSEKILDCFASFTVPIYYGAPDIGTFFNPQGIICLDDDFSLDKISFELYSQMSDAVSENFKIATEFNTVEDILWQKWLRPCFLIKSEV